MTNPQDPTQDPTVGLLEVLDGTSARVRRAAFTRLLDTAAPVDVPSLAVGTHLTEHEVEAALADLADVGAITRQSSSSGPGAPGAPVVAADGPVIAAGGLSVAPAKHPLLLAGRAFWTWCAFDGIGIPAALDADAVLQTRCPACDQQIQVHVVDGQPPSNSPVVGWLPGKTCTNVQDDFCPEANLFCTDTHLASWRAEAGDPPGTAATLPELAEIGRQVWADVTSPTD